MFSADGYWITIAEAKGFSADASRVFTIAEFEALTQCLSVNPLFGEVIPDTGGVRRVRWPAASQGKNGRVRILYYFRDLNTPVYLLALYERGQRMRLSSGDAQIVRALVEEIVASYGERWAARRASDDGAA